MENRAIPTGRAGGSIDPEPAAQSQPKALIPIAVLDEIADMSRRLRNVAADLGERYPDEITLDAVFLLALGISNRVSRAQGKTLTQKRSRRNG